MIAVKILIARMTLGDACSQVREFRDRAEADEFVGFCNDVSNSLLGGAWEHRVESYDAHANENGATQ